METGKDSTAGTDQVADGAAGKIQIVYGALDMAVHSSHTTVTLNTTGLGSAKCSSASCFLLSNN